MIWEAIQRAKTEKLNLDVVWLDPANAYRSVPHQMIQLTLRTYHVPEDIQMMLDKYFRGFRMKFSSNSYTTDWINLEIGIAMGCKISSILFVMAMEVILKAAEGSAGPANLGGGCYMPPLKAFMDDTIIIWTNNPHTMRVWLESSTVRRKIAGRHLGVMTWVWPGPLRVSEIKGRNTCYEGDFFCEDSLLFGSPVSFLIKWNCKITHVRLVSKWKSQWFTKLSPRFFAKKKSQILHPKCKILQAEKVNFAKILQCFYTACNANTALVHPQSSIFFYLNVD